MKAFHIMALVLASAIAVGCISSKPKPSPTANAQILQAVTDGRHLWELGKLDEAETTFQKILMVNTNNVEARYYLSLVRREQNTHQRPAIFTYHHTVVTNYLKMPLEQRSLASFGHFDSSTTVEDIINRVGPPDTAVNISGIHEIYYMLPAPDTNLIQIQSSGSSFIVCVTHGKTILYERDMNDW